ncbi:beta-ketoacyl-ACP synthase II [Spirochaeta africana]|uniref:3-oxoacyl-[acyl-carrier-protein] synthase 2 n=1 Tax=Spirochaeta africana (strain ATCC 700263 / DSM 8902 / Z-7692) TaxID=889378 RepID=H9UFR4_SPIAZ|nr:beta-ketoacyl-ACP synthase II [Spirochaeta africana]AFG36357.1 beta-ketoacyl-acyl-carrier-protein synthase II [Spirochaeta africana DSM 8902]
MSVEKRTVVVTGMGAITPIGNSVPELWDSIQAGRSGAGPITRFDAADFATGYAAEVKDFDPKNWMDRRDARKMDRFSQYAVAATREALQDAGLLQDGKLANTDSERTAVVLGVGIGGFETFEDSLRALVEKGPSRVPPMTIPKLISNIGPGNIGIVYGIHGPAFSLATACASGTDALTNAKRWIESGLVDVVVAGGVEASITPLGIAGFNVIQALSTGYADDPSKASRPFDKNRDGFLMGEGAGIMVLESAEHAARRKARVYATLAGTAMTCDANHLTAPHPEGMGAIAAMKLALAEAGLQPEDIDYINAHGTSTPINDPTETTAIKSAFGSHAYQLKVSSTKSMTGHCIGAAGGIEAIISVKALQEQYFPATINLDEPDEACDLDYVPNTGVSGRIRAVMSNSLGFGGHNGIVIFTAE